MRGTEWRRGRDEEGVEKGGQMERERGRRRGYGEKGEGNGVETGEEMERERRRRRRGETEEK